MKRHCVAEDEFIGNGDKRCGMFFDDVERSVICPHDLLQPVFNYPSDCLIYVLQIEFIYEESMNIKVGSSFDS